ncbi:serine/threonine-protein kinase [Gordonia sp. (in: high G+C Gram-positive bacteria)]|uniref:serine/threonine-protein kinase n=1 Tax=Gordonia sp. (in: high G+C Gram-positive bacteria) TaxID=84139 RepID=UPI002617687E|nr:serine/threonine-protein kinase [Gordonia sp. (in: high G+C Gram-positive bacteria)]
MERGQQIAGYEVIDRLGQGGMGEVYLVWNPTLERREAMKVISMAGSGNDDFQRRFSAEAKTTAALDHPSIVTIYQHGVAGRQPWFTMSYIKGLDLAAARLSEHEEILRASEQVADALDYAHRNGVVHRDIKPANILIRRDPQSGLLERAVVVDFGIAKLADGTSLTATDAFVGTLRYSAPEVIGGARAGARSDQYSLACTLYEVLAGRPVFDETVASAIMMAHVSKTANPLSTHRPDLRPLDPVFARALAKEPAQRYPDCRSFIAALRASTTAQAPVHPQTQSVPPRVATPPPSAPVRSGPHWDTLPSLSTAPGWYAPAASGDPRAVVPYFPTPPRRTGGWKVLQCLWTLVPLLTCGILGPAAYLYCAIRINKVLWWVLFGASVVLWRGCAAIIGSVPTAAPASDAALLTLWLLPTIGGLALSPLYIRDLEAKLDRSSTA